MNKEISVCPKCKSKNIDRVSDSARFHSGIAKCLDCGYEGIIPIIVKKKG